MKEFSVLEPMKAKSKHPIGLTILFFTEMWERFSYYCMLAVLSLYMNDQATGGLGFSTALTAQVYGLYIAFVYFTPLLGGWVADRKWGYGKTIIFGGALMGLGHFLLAFPPLPFFFAGLVCLIFGNGFFKPNISTLLGNMYYKMPEKRDEAYNIFYMGINVGAFFSPLVAAYMRAHYGWHFAFGAAGLGMIISLMIFTLFRKHTQFAEINHKNSDPVPEQNLTKKQEKDRITALMLVFGIVIVFWMAFHQNGLTLTFWARDNTDSTISPEIWQAVNPFFVLLFTPLLVWFWNWLRLRKMEPSTAAKIGIGMLLTGAAYSVMVVAGISGGDFGKVSGGWLLSTYAVITIAELCLSPMGLSLVNKLAPTRMKGFLMGGWFASTAIGNYLSGFLGSYWDEMTHSNFFLILTVASIGAAGLLLLVIKKIRPTIHEAEQMALEGALKQ